jgi:hypothetical protein
MATYERLAATCNRQFEAAKQKHTSLVVAPRPGQLRAAWQIQCTLVVDAELSTGSPRLQRFGGKGVLFRCEWHS